MRALIAEREKRKKGGRRSGGGIHWLMVRGGRWKGGIKEREKRRIQKVRHILRRFLPLRSLPARLLALMLMLISQSV